MSELTTFAQRLTTARTQKNISSSSLCSKVGMSTTTLYNWEHELSSPRGEKSRALVKAVADALGVTERWLTSGVGEMDAAKAEAQRLAAIEARTPPTTVRYRAADKRQLEDIELLIKHLRELSLSTDEKKAIFMTLSEIRTDLEVKVLFGVSA